MHDHIMRLYDNELIDHATWCNALRYDEGDYRDHRLCRNAWLLCARMGVL